MSPNPGVLSQPTELGGDVVSHGLGVLFGNDIDQLIMSTPKPHFLDGCHVTERTNSVVSCTTIYNLLWRRTAKRELRDVLSELLATTSQQPACPAAVVRQTFNDQSVPVPKIHPNHTHGKSAADRSAASAFCASMPEHCGLEPYYVQQSMSDQRRGREGSRAFYWGKDLVASPRAYRPTDRSTLVMVDVDYYVDMPWMLTDEFKPVLLYTFTPTRAACCDGEYSFTFEKDASVTYQVSGGGEYSHHVWDYGCDSIVVRDWWFGIPWTTATYNVDRKRVDDHHSIVLLTPTAKWTGMFSLLASIINGPSLKRFNPIVNGEYVRMKVQDASGLSISTGMTGHYGACTLSANADGAISIMAKTSTNKLTLTSVMQYLEKDEELRFTRTDAAPLYSYYLKNTIRNPFVTAYPVKEAVRSYEYVPLEEHDPEAKDTVIGFMQPMVHGAFAPVASEGNDKSCIKHRLTNVAPPKDLKKTNHMDKVMREFVKFLIPNPHELIPEELDRVYEQQNRPTQRRLIEQASNQQDRKIVKAFQKKECYGKLSAPRNISTLPADVKVEYSRYMYALADYVKQAEHIEWYAFSKKPKEVAERVCQVIEDADHAVPTDFEKLDGTISGLMRELEKLVLLRAFHPSCHAEVMDLHDNQFNMTGLTRFFVKYYTGTSRASGSPETSIFNTIVNAFIAYAAWRSSKMDGEWVKPSVAWSKLGLYAGDDGLTADIDPKVYMRTATNFGLRLEADVVKRGERGLNFLSRYYTSEVWYGCTASCCDIRRQLSKFHVTVKLQGVTPEAKLLEKSRAFYLTDKNTPVLGEVVSKVVELNGGLPSISKHSQLVRFWSEEEPDNQYPNPPHEEYEALLVDQLPFLDREVLNSWLQKARTLSDIIKAPLLCEPEKPATKSEAVLEGDVVESDSGPTPTQPVTTSESSPPSMPSASPAMRDAQEIPNPSTPSASVTTRDAQGTGTPSTPSASPNQDPRDAQGSTASTPSAQRKRDKRNAKRDARRKKKENTKQVRSLAGDVIGSIVTTEPTRVDNRSIPANTDLRTQREDTDEGTIESTNENNAHLDRTNHAAAGHAVAAVHSTGNSESTSVLSTDSSNSCGNSIHTSTSQRKRNNRRRRRRGRNSKLES